MPSADIDPLAHRLYALIPEPLRQWIGEAVDPDERDRLANHLLRDMTAVPRAPMPMEGEDHEGVEHARIISEALAGFVTPWGCRDGHFDEAVDQAQAALVTSRGGVVHEPGDVCLAIGTPLTVAAIAHLSGWVCVLDVPEADQWPS
jgi:hypothetical protein